MRTSVLTADDHPCPSPASGWLGTARRLWTWPPKWGVGSRPPRSDGPFGKGTGTSPSLRGLVLQGRSGRPIGSRTISINRFSPSELRVLGLIAEPKTSRELADTLCISQRTVENHRAHLSTKLGIQGSCGLLRFALENRSRLTLSKTTQAD